MVNISRQIGCDNEPGLLFLLCSVCPNLLMSLCPSAPSVRLSICLWHCGTAAPANKLLATHLQLDMFCMSVSSAAARRQHDDDDNDGNGDDGTRVVPPLLLLLLSVTAATRPALKADTRPHGHMLIPPVAARDVSRASICMEKRYLCGQELQTEGEGKRCSVMGAWEGRGVTACDSYCLPMSVSAENLPAINMLKAGEEPEQAEIKREMESKPEVIGSSREERRRGSSRKWRVERGGSWRKGNVISQSTAANED